MRSKTVERRESVLFWVSIGGVILISVSPAVPFLEDISKNPTAWTGIGMMLSYSLSQMKSSKNNIKRGSNEEEEEGGEEQ